MDIDLSSANFQKLKILSLSCVKATLARNSDGSPTAKDTEAAGLKNGKEKAASFKNGR